MARAHKKAGGENPVIAGRVSQALYKRIKDSAQASGRSMSEELAFRTEQAFNFEASFESIAKVKAQEDLVIKLGREAALMHWNIKPVPGRPGWYFLGDVPPQELVAWNPTLEKLIERAAERAAEIALKKARKE